MLTDKDRLLLVNELGQHISKVRALTDVSPIRDVAGGICGVRRLEGATDIHLVDDAGSRLLAVGTWLAERGAQWRVYTARGSQAIIMVDPGDAEELTDEDLQDLT